MAISLVGQAMLCTVTTVSAMVVATYLFCVCVDQATFIVWICTSRILMPRVFTKFSVCKIKFPYRITELSLSTNPELGIPVVSLSIRSFELKFSLQHLKSTLWRSFLGQEETEAGLFCQVVLEGLDISIAKLTLMDVMKPSSVILSKEAFIRLMTTRAGRFLPSVQGINTAVLQLLSKLLSVRVTDLSSTMSFNDCGVTVAGATPLMTVCSDAWSDVNVHLRICIDSGRLTLSRTNDSAFLSLLCSQYIITNKFHIPSGCMDVHVQTSPTCEIVVELVPFIQFYHAYQIVEDDVLEIKMVRQQDCGNKISTSAQFACLDVQCRDDRCGSVLAVRLELVEMVMKSWRLNSEKKRITAFADEVTADVIDLYVQNWSFRKTLDFTENLEKLMKLSVGAVTFDDNQLMHVAECSMEISKFVNYSPHYRDKEEIKIYAKEVCMRVIDDRLLKWLCVLQDASLVLPITRFAHEKDSTAVYSLFQAQLRLLVFEEAESPPAAPTSDDRYTNRKVKNPWDTPNIVVDLSDVHARKGFPREFEDYSCSFARLKATASIHISHVINNKRLIVVPVEENVEAVDSDFSTSAQTTTTNDACFVHAWDATHVEAEFFLGKTAMDWERLSIRKLCVSEHWLGNSSIQHRVPMLQIPRTICTIDYVLADWEGRGSSVNPVVNMTARIKLLTITIGAAGFIRMMDSYNFIVKASATITESMRAVKLRSTVYSDFPQFRSMVHEVIDHKSYMYGGPYNLPVQPTPETKASNFFHVETILATVTLRYYHSSSSSESRPPLKAALQFLSFEYKSHSDHQQEMNCKEFMLHINDYDANPLVHTERVYVGISSTVRVHASSADTEFTETTYELEAQHILVTVSPRMFIGDAIDAINKQREAFLVARKNLCSADDEAVALFKEMEEKLSIPGSDHDPAEIRKEDTVLLMQRLYLELCQLQPDKFLVVPQTSSATVYKARFSTLKIVFDSVYENEYVHEFGAAQWTNFSVALLSNKTDSEVFEDLLNLDENTYSKQFCDFQSPKVDPRLQRFASKYCSSEYVKIPWIATEFMMYLRPFGGDLTLAFDEFLYQLKPLQEKYVSMEKGRIQGKAYSASVLDLNKPSPESLVPLADDAVTRAICSFNAPMTSLNDVKYYFDLSFTVDRMAAVLEPIIDRCTEAITLVLATCSSTDAYPFPALALWDGWRYNYHGRLQFLAHEFNLTKVLHDTAVVKIILGVGCDDFSYFIDLTSFELAAKDMVIDLNIFRPSDDSVNTVDISSPGKASSPAKRFPLFFYDSYDDVTTPVCFGGDNKKYLFSNRPSWERIIRIPGLQLSLFHSPIDPENIRYSHHKVPTVPSQLPVGPIGALYGTESDKFADFRTKPDSIKWSLEVKLMSLRPNDSIFALAKLDVIHRLAEAVLVQDSDFEEDLDSSFSNKADIKEMSPELQEEMATWRNLEASSIEPSLFDILHQVDIQIEMDNFLLCSWSKSDDHCGVVITVCKTQFQLRFVRESLPLLQKKSSYHLNQGQLDSNHKPFSGSRSKMKQNRKSFRKSRSRSSNRTSDPFEDVPRLELGAFQIDHLFAETENVEIFVREWIPTFSSFDNMPDTSGPTDFYAPPYSPQRSVDSNATVQHLIDVDDIKDLLNQLTRLAFATSIVITATESGQVAGKSNTFSRRGVLMRSSLASAISVATLPKLPAENTESTDDILTIGPKRRHRIFRAQFKSNSPPPHRRAQIQTPTETPSPSLFSPQRTEAVVRPVDQQQKQHQRQRKTPQQQVIELDDCIFNSSSEAAERATSLRQRNYACRTLSLMAHYSKLPAEEQERLLANAPHLHKFCVVVAHLLESRPVRARGADDTKMVQSNYFWQNVYLRYIFLDEPPWRSSRDWRSAGYMCNCRVHRTATQNETRGFSGDSDWWHQSVASHNCKSEGHHLSILTFKRNHDVMMPAARLLPANSLPAAEKRKLFKDAHGKSALQMQKLASDNGRHLRSNSIEAQDGATLLQMAKQSIIRDHYLQRKRMKATQSSFGSKIWGLRVTNCRLLWTLPIRDVLFKYGFAFTKYFAFNETEGVVVKSQEKLVPFRQRRLKAGQPNALMGSLQGNEDNAEGNKISRRSGDNAALEDFLNYNEDFVSNFLDELEKEDASSSPGGASSPQFGVFHQSKQARDRNSMSQLLHRSSSSQVYNRMSSERERRYHTSYPYSVNSSPMEGSSTLSRLDSDENLTNLSPQRETQSAHRRSSSGNSVTMLRPSVGPHRSSFGPSAASSKLRRAQSRRSFNGGRGHANNMSTATIFPEMQRIHDHNWNGNEDDNGTGVTQNTAMSTSLSLMRRHIPVPLSISKPYLMIEFVDIQINFLDLKTHSSLLVVAGRSMVEGFRQTNALFPRSILNPNLENDDIADSAVGQDAHVLPSALDPTGGPTAKRQHEFKVRLDGVSTFTVNSCPPGGASEGLRDDLEDAVYWKRVEGDNIESLDSLSRHYAKETVDVIFNTLFKQLLQQAQQAAQGSMHNLTDPSVSGLSGSTRSVFVPLVPIAVRGRRPSSVVRVAGFGSSVGAVPGSSTGRETGGEALKIAIRDFTIRVNYLFWQDVTTGEAKEMFVEETFNAEEIMVSQFILDIPQVCSDIVSSQFYVCINVIRNLLLIPPAREITENESIQNAFNQGEMNSVFRASTDPIDLKRQACRAELRNIVEQDISKREGGADFNRRGRDPTSQTENASAVVESKNEMDEPSSFQSGSALTRYMEVVIGKCSWILRSENNVVEPLEAGFTGVYAQFIYTEDRHVSAIFEMQRLWVRLLPADTVPAAVLGVDSGALMVGAGTGQDSANSAINGSSSNNDLLDDPSWVILPLLYTEIANEKRYNREDICCRCGTAFTTETNGTHACDVHEEDDGTPGTFQEYIVYHDAIRLTDTGSGNAVAAETCADNISSSVITSKACSSSSSHNSTSSKYSVISMWSCCGSQDPQSRGCCTRPHSVKEIMLSVRAFANPSLRVFNDALNMEITIFNELEMNIFPGVCYTLFVRINRSLLSNIHKYFSIDENLISGDSKNLLADDEEVGNDNDRNSNELDDTRLNGHERETARAELPPGENDVHFTDEGRHSGSNIQHHTPIDLSKRRGNTGTASAESRLRATSADEAEGSSYQRDTKSSKKVFSIKRASAGIKSLFGMLGKGKKSRQDGTSDHDDKENDLFSENDVFTDRGDHRGEGSVTTSAAHSKKRYSISDDLYSRFGGSGISTSRSATLSTSPYHLDPNNKHMGTPSSQTFPPAANASQMSRYRGSAKGIPRKNSSIVNQEALYIQYLRIGDISVNITTTGFGINLTNHNAVVDPLICKKEMTDWHMLLVKLESMALWSLTVNTAKSFSKMTLFGWKNKPQTVMISSALAAEHSLAHSDVQGLAHAPARGAEDSAEQQRKKELLLGKRK
jgi:hypothetical protein